MTEPFPADTPVAIDRVDRTRGDDEGVRLRLTGRWLGSGDAAEQEPLLVIQLQGRRHRFPALRDERATPALPAGAWEATFSVPAWAEPRQEGQAALWLGNAVVPVPVPGTVTAGVGAAPASEPPAGVPPAAGMPPPAAATPVMPAAGVSPPAPPSAPAPPGASPPPPIVDSGRPGPLAELLFKESVAALHAELEQRSTEAARLRASLANAQAELEARTGMQAALESAHAELRSELQQLMSAVGVQREEFERRLRDVESRLSTAESERDALRAELDGERARAARDRDADRERAAAQLAELAAARDAQLAELTAARDAQLAELIAARDAQAGQVIALRDQLAVATAAGQQRADEVGALREQLAGAHVARDAAAGEVAGLRGELERLGSELAVTREQYSAQGGDLGEAQRLLSDARALTEQLRGQS
jgi:hypothetical protein